MCGCKSEHKAKLHLHTFLHADAAQDSSTKERNARGMGNRSPRISANSTANTCILELVAKTVGTSHAEFWRLSAGGGTWVASRRFMWHGTCELLPDIQHFEASSSLNSSGARYCIFGSFNYKINHVCKLLKADAHLPVIHTDVPSSHHMILEIIRQDHEFFPALWLLSSISSRESVFVGIWLPGFPPQVHNATVKCSGVPSRERADLRERAPHFPHAVSVGERSLARWPVTYQLSHLNY